MAASCPLVNMNPTANPHTRQHGAHPQRCQHPPSPYLQNDPVSLLCSHVQSVLSHHLLSLPQGHVVEFPIVYGKFQLFP